MNAFDLSHRPYLLGAFLHLLPAVVWTTLALSLCRSYGTARPQGTVLRLVRLISWTFAAHYSLNVALDVLRFDTEGKLFHGFCLFTNVTTLAMLPMLRHLVPSGALEGRPVGRWWLAANYGLPVATAVVLLLVPTISLALLHGYCVFLTGLILWEAGRLARRGWRPVFMAELPFSGFLLLALVLFGGVLAVALTEDLGVAWSPAWTFSHSFVGLALAAPFAWRLLGEVVRNALLFVVRLAAALLLYFGTRVVAAGAPRPELALVVELGGLLALLLVLGPGGRWIGRVVDRLLLRQSHRWEEELRSRLRALTPELGVAECCRRAVAALPSTLRLRGAAVLLDASGEALVSGDLDADAIAAVWPREGASDAGTSELPAAAFDLLWLGDVRLKRALYEARITWVVPIAGPRRRHGHLFVAAGPWGSADGAAKLTTLEGFARELSLVLDAAELRARAVAVERDLAHAEKLAAIGEAAARIAHEIRNPVTAARSLAQLMAQEPNSPLNSEHAGLVVRELDRVERQVRSLLRFASPETYTLRTLSWTELVEATLGDLETHTLGDDVELVRELESGVLVEGDPERLRQVLCNLVTNAADAVAETLPPRRVSVTLCRRNGGSRLTVADSGPGVEDALLPRLFEPFVSRKSQGTGLGLAIARRIVEAHHGTIVAAPGPGSGMRFVVELPALGSAREAPASGAAVSQDFGRPS